MAIIAIADGRRCSTFCARGDGPSSIVTPLPPSCSATARLGCSTDCTATVCGSACEARLDAKADDARAARTSDDDAIIVLRLLCRRCPASLTSESDASSTTAVNWSSAAAEPRLMLLSARFFFLRDL